MSDIKNLQYPVYIDVILRCKKKNLKISASCFVKVTVIVRFQYIEIKPKYKKGG